MQYGGRHADLWEGFLAGRESMREEPIDMVLHCRSCGKQHIDAPIACDMGVGCEESGRCYAVAQGCPDRCTKWSNPPHRSHLCHYCGYIWRPADVPTNGVAAVKTKGKNDSPVRKGKAEPVALLKHADEAWGHIYSAICYLGSSNTGGREAKAVERARTAFDGFKDAVLASPRPTLPPEIAEDVRVLRDGHDWFSVKGRERIRRLVDFVAKMGEVK